ncbi:hypothetical protein RN001_006639 [Aquatica leii]|uniref:Uncharacterized protein n=1 Tax=Aquatica leii TaxID=1421715 RepID=A0AAN7SSA4_9COLE|nr:hypothetical protein RN001_006639 [Aquatica leii]
MQVRIKERKVLLDKKVLATKHQKLNEINSQTGNSDNQFPHENVDAILDAPEDLAGPLESAQVPLPSHIRKIITNNIIKVPNVEPSIQHNAAESSLTIIKNALNPQLKQKLFLKYPSPSNCCLDSPLLNPEPKACIQKTHLKRNARLAAVQQQIDAGLSVIGRVLTKVLKDLDNRS